MRNKDEKLAQIAIKWAMESVNNQYMLALTLTTNDSMLYRKQHKAAASKKDGWVYRKQHRDTIDAQATAELKYVRQKVNTEYFGGNWRRKGKRLNMFTFREEIDNKPHFHLLIDVSSKNLMDVKKIGAMFVKYWKKTKIGGTSNVIDIASDRQGWIGYGVKSLTKYDTRVIDVENTIINQAWTQ